MIWMGNALVSKGVSGVYGERILAGYRVWDPFRSKLAAIYHLGKGTELKDDMKILYLGAAHGTTVSHIADYVEVVYAVEFAPRPMQDLLQVARIRTNIVPIMADASRPDLYACLLEEVDLIYQDIAQPKQAEIAIANGIFLKKNGMLVMILKTRSVDVRRLPETILAETRAILNRHYNVLDALWLDPYHRDHAAILCEAIK